jgi:hypothetical protein
MAAQHGERFKTALTISVGVLAWPVMLIALPFLLHGYAYHEFNKFYYQASLISLFCGLGLDWSVGRHRAGAAVIVKVIFASSLIASVVLAIVGAITRDITQLVQLWLFAEAVTTLQVFAAARLLQGSLSGYAELGVLRASVVFLVIALATWAGIDAQYAATIGIVGLLVLVLPWAVRKFPYRALSAPRLYIDGIAALSISAAGSLALTADKTIASLALPTLEANSYVFAWALVSPAIYAGNAVERFLLSRHELDWLTVIRASAALLGFAWMYGVALMFLLNYALGLPDSVNRDSVVVIAGLMAFGVGIFAAIHYPTMAALTKRASSRTLLMVGVSHLVLTVVATIVVGIVVTNLRNHTMSINVFDILVFVGILLGVLALIKAGFLFLVFHNAKAGLTGA